MASDAAARARLAAIASGGTAGAAAFDQAQADQLSGTQSALDAAALQASSPSMPDTQSGINALLGDPYSGLGTPQTDQGQNVAQNLANSAAGASYQPIDYSSQIVAPGPLAAADKSGTPISYADYALAGSKEAEYMNAVKGRALQGQANDTTKATAIQSADESNQIGQGSHDLANALAAQQAYNEAAVGGPGAVIHGIADRQPQPALSTEQFKNFSGQAAPQGTQTPPNPTAIDTRFAPPQPAAPETLGTSPAQLAAMRQMYVDLANRAVNPQVREDYLGESAQTQDPARRQTFNALADAADPSRSSPADARAAMQPTVDFVSNPLNNFIYQRRVADFMGEDPYSAMSRFGAPSDAQRLAYLTDQAKLDEYQKTGFATPAEEQSALTNKQNLEDRALAEQAGVDPAILTELGTKTRLGKSGVAKWLSDPAWGNVQTIAQDQIKGINDPNNPVDPQLAQQFFVKKMRDANVPPELQAVAEAYYAPLFSG